MLQTSSDTTDFMNVEGFIENEVRTSFIENVTETINADETDINMTTETLISGPPYAQKVCIFY